MIPSKATAVILAAALAALLLPACTHVGVEPAEGLIYDNTHGTMYISPDFMKDYDPAKLKNYRSFQASKVTVPFPFTFGALSFGWGQISTKWIMDEGKFKKLVYAEYRRLNVAFVYENYEITAYGE